MKADFSPDKPKNRRNTVVFQAFFGAARVEKMPSGCVPDLIRGSLELLQQIMVLRQQGVTQFMVACDPGVGVYAAEAINALFTFRISVFFNRAIFTLSENVKTYFIDTPTRKC